MVKPDNMLLYHTRAHTDSCTHTCVTYTHAHTHTCIECAPYRKEALTKLKAKEEKMKMFKGLFINWLLSW